MSDPLDDLRRRVRDRVLESLRDEYGTPTEARPMVERVDGDRPPVPAALRDAFDSEAV